MKVTIMQPAYLPWLGFFHRITLSDLLIVLDHVEIDRNSKTGFAHRNKVRTRDGWCWLTVPLKTKGKRGQLQINQLEICEDRDWARRHWNTLRHNYAKAAFFSEHRASLEALYERPWRQFIDLARASLDWHLDAFGIRTETLYSSAMNVPGSKDELILNLCREVGADTYISGPLGRQYLQKDAFHQSGIAVLYHDYEHPTYRQMYPGFEPYMAAIDLLLNHGSQSRDILDNGREAAAA